MILDANGVVREPITLDKLKRFMEFESLLRTLDWTLACKKCRNPLRGDNATQSTRLSVACRCKEVVFDAGHH